MIATRLRGAASPGARLALTSVHGLEIRGGKLGLATTWVGFGQDASVALERVHNL